MKFLFTLILFSMSIVGYAQQEGSALQFGLLIGPSYTQSRDHSPLPVKTKIRSTSGLSIQYQLAKIHLKTNLLFENKGYSITYLGRPDGPDPSMYDRTKDFTVQFNNYYLTIPVLVGIPVLKTGLTLNFGSYAALLLKATMEDEQMGVQEVDSDKKLDYGLSGGVGYSYPITSALHLSVEIRHNYGLNNISNGPSSVYISSTNMLFGLNYTLNSN